MPDHDITFSRPYPGACPQYRDYYIQDRFAGKDVHGNDAYDYALFRRFCFIPIKKVSKRRQGYKYLNQITGLSRLELKYRSPSVIVNDRECLGIHHGYNFYKFMKRTGEIFMKPDEDVQISAWFMSYSECLEWSKETLSALTETDNKKNEVKP